MITTGAYVQTAEVYGLTEEQHESGQVTETWDYENPVASINCVITSFDTESSYVGRSREVINIRSFENDMLKMKCAEVLSRDDRIGNIRTKKTGKVMFYDLERTDAGAEEIPTTYEIVGSYPVADPFGQVLEQVYVLERARDL